MNVIIAYLETMFSTYPQTERLLEAKAELRGMMEDAYHDLISDGRSENEAVGQVIRDFGNLDEVAPVLGIRSDLAPSETVHEPRVASATRPGADVIRLEEAQGYAAAQERIRYRVSTAIMLFILSPVLLIALPALADAGLLPMQDTTAAFIGLFALFVLVAGGVGVILATSRETALYKRVAEGRFTPNPEVTRWAESLADRHERARIRGLQIAITLWIFAPLPLIASALLLGQTPYGDALAVLGVVFVLIVVGIGLQVLLPRTWAHSVRERLSRGGGRPQGEDEEHSVVGIIASFYWPLVTAIYLAWSFIGNAWDSSWIIWPIAAVLFSAIAAGGGAIERTVRDRR